MFFYEEILREFQKKKVKYILVGGIAYVIFGGRRNTYDMDILVQMKGENLRKIISILQKKGYKVKQPVNPMDFADAKIRREWIRNKNLKAFNFYKDELKYEEVDIIIDSPVSFEEASKDTVKINLGKLKLPVINIDNLIKMKKVTGRDQDKRDVEHLRALKRIRSEK